MTLFAQIFAQIADNPASAIAVLAATNAGTITALGIVYRDCRVDRQRLWAKIGELQKHIRK